MIYLADDYLTKYSDALSYLLARSISEGYTFEYIQSAISYSKAISELEKSNITLLAFSSLEAIYHDIFPQFDNNFAFNEYDAFGWCGYIYMHLFLSMKITFEALFFLIPIKEMLSLYPLYHEMSVSQIDEYAKNKMKHTMLDIILKEKKMSNQDLGKITGLSISTINSLRYKKRDIAKLEADKLQLISIALNVKMETLLPSIHLLCQ